MSLFGEQVWKRIALRDAAVDAAMEMAFTSAGEWPAAWVIDAGCGAIRSVNMGAVEGSSRPSVKRLGKKMHMRCSQR